MSLRVLVTAQPALGHLNPMTGVARALAAAGHRVVVACGASGVDRVRAAGIDCVAAGLDTYSDRHAPTEPIVADLLAICRELRPDLVVRDSTEFGGCLAAELLGLPHASVQVGAHCPPEPPWDLIGAELTRVCRAVGLATRSPFGLLYRYLHLVPVPPAFVPDGALRPATARTIAPIGFDDPCPAPLPASLARAPRPLVHATMGTVACAWPGALDGLVADLRTEPFGLVVTVGPERDPRAFHPDPPRLHVERYLPQSRLLPLCDAVVCHGGQGTVLAALAAGVPLVLVPVLSDQPANARRCAELGVGVVAGDGRRGPGPGALARAVRRVLSDPSFAARARMVGAEIAGLPGPGQVAGMLEDLVAVRPAPVAR